VATSIVQSVMSEPALTLDADESVRQAARRMWANRAGSALVLDDGELVGIVTERDLTWLVSEGRDPERTRLDDVMSSPVETIEPAANVEQAIAQMEEAGVRRLAVELDGELQGVVSVTDIAYEEAELARRARENVGRRWQD
jgi:CBS domain-containing protein